MEKTNTIYILKPYKYIKRNSFIKSKVDSSKVTEQYEESKLNRFALRIKERYFEQEKAILSSKQFLKEFAYDVMYNTNPNIINQLVDFFNLDEQTIRKEVQEILFNEEFIHNESIFIKHAKDGIFTTNLERIINFYNDYYFDFTKIPSNKYSAKEDAIGLFTELAKIDPFNEKEILKFALHFGLPAGLNALQQERFVFIGVSHFHLLKLFLEYKNIFNLYIAAKEENCQTINNIIQNVRYFQRENDEIDKKFPEPIEYDFDDDLDSLEESDTMIFLKEHLAKRLHKLLENRTERLFIYDGIFREVNYFTDLFAIAYQQIKNSLLEDTSVRKCRNCGHYFEVNHGKQSFCPRLPLVKRSSCEIAYYKKQKRNRGE